METARLYQIDVINTKSRRFRQNLKNQEIPGLDENSKVPELAIVHIPRDSRPVEPVFATTRARDGPREVELRAVPQMVDQADESSAALLLLLLVVVRVDQVLELGPTELPRADAEDKAYGVHEVGLAGTIGPDNRREVVERPDGLKAFVGLEILEL